MSLPPPWYVQPRAPSTYLLQDCYVHDVPGAGIHLVGGTSHSLVERTAIFNTSFGINLGFQTELEYFNTADNPKLFENRNTTVRNSIIAAVTKTLNPKTCLNSSGGCSNSRLALWHCWG